MDVELDLLHYFHRYIFHHTQNIVHVDNQYRIDAIDMIDMVDDIRDILLLNSRTTSLVGHLTILDCHARHASIRILHSMMKACQSMLLSSLFLQIQLYSNPDTRAVARTGTIDLFWINEII